MVAFIGRKARRPAAATPRRLLLTLVVLAAIAETAHAQSGSVAGRVRTRDGEPVQRALVLVSGAGVSAFTDTLGIFRIDRVPVGSWRIDVRRIGYRPAQTRVEVRAGDTARVDLRLQEVPVEITGITAEAADAERRRFQEEAQVSTRSLDVRDIRSVPTLAETDLLRTVQLLPGVVARSDFSVGLNVRGGDADQNLVLLDGQVVFNPFHLGGLVSTFADDAVEGLDFLVGGFPARYGGRLSSVLDVSQRTGRTDGVHGSASVSLLSSKAHLEGPLPGGRGSWLLAARRTYADQLVDAFTSETFPYHFQDVIARASHPLAGGALSATAFASGDYFDFLLAEATSGQPAQSFLFDWGNTTLGITYRRPLGERGLLVQRMGGSGFFANIDVGAGLFTFHNRVRRIAASGDLEWRTGAHNPAIGYVLERHDISYDAGSAEVGLDVARLTYHPTALEVYAEDQWRPAHWLLVRPGARFTHVSGREFTGIAPRFASKAFLDDETAITVSAGRYHQYIHSLRNEEIPISLFEFWVGADRFVPVASADHAVLGVERWFGNSTSLTVEGFWKKMRDLIDGDPTEDPAVVGDEFVRARGTAHGLDLYLRRTRGRVTGWVSYTLAKVTRTLETGERFVPGQDRRHTFNAIASWSGPLGAEWTVRFGYGSPLPFTAIAGQWVHRFYDPGRNIFIGAFTEPYRVDRNSSRYPAYSRLDLAGRWRFQWLGARWNATASLLNTYARTNVFVYFYDYTTTPPRRRGFSQFPFLPTVGLEVSF